MFSSMKKLSLAFALTFAFTSVNAMAESSEAGQIDKDLVQMRQMIDQMKAQGTPEDTIAEAEKNLTMMKAIAPMMKAIENDSVGSDEKLKTAAKAVKNAENPADGMPALDAYLTLKKASVDAKQAGELQAGYDAMKEMLNQMPVEEESEEDDDEEGDSDEE